MFIFAHLGLGLQVSKPFSRGLQKRWILLGTLLPDIIDKTAYYGLSFVTHKSGAALGLISGTRTFAHTAIFCLIFIFYSLYKKNKLLLAISIGVFTHLFLDGIGDVISIEPILPEVKNKLALFFPLYGFRFPTIPFTTLGEHLTSYFDPYFYFTEVLGFLFLIKNLVVLKKKQL